MNFTVLIVDDEAMPRTVLREHIPWEELSVTKVCLATDGAEAVEQARESRRRLRMEQPHVSVAHPVSGALLEPADGTGTRLLVAILQAN